MLKFTYSYAKEKEIAYLPSKYPLATLYHAANLFQEWVDAASAGDALNTTKLCSAYTRMWEEVKPKFFEALVNFFEIELAEFPNLEVTAYLSRIPRYPFNFKGRNKWFAVPIYGLPQNVLRVVAHELTHLYTFNLFPKELSRFDKDMIDNIKEVSATIAIGTHFQSFLRGVKEKFHERNQEFGDFATQKIKDPQNPKFREFLLAGEEFTKKSQ